MAAHEQFADDLALYAIGSLPAPEAAALEQHLKDCATCRRELQALRGDASLLALSAAGPAPPARSRDKLLATLKNEPRRQRMILYHAKPWWAIAPVAASLALAIFGLFLWRENRNLREQLVQAQQTATSYWEQMVKMRRQSAEERHYAMEAYEMASLFNSPDAQHVSLRPMRGAPQPSGRAMYLRDKGRLVFMASNMPRLPKSKMYELWLIPMSGHAPMPAGTFMPDEKGEAMVMDPPIPPGTEAKAFAVTVENSSGSEKPTMPMVLMGSAPAPNEGD